RSARMRAVPLPMPAPSGHVARRPVATASSWAIPVITIDTGLLSGAVIPAIETGTILWLGGHNTSPMLGRAASQLGPQVVPGMGVCWQPCTGLQLSAVHASLSLQLSGAPPVQVPPLHTSPVVQALPSLHGAVLFVWTHPVAESQESL